MSCLQLNHLRQHLWLDKPPQGICSILIIMFLSSRLLQMILMNTSDCSWCYVFFFQTGTYAIVDASGDPTTLPRRLWAAWSSLTSPLRRASRPAWTRCCLPFGFFPPKSFLSKSFLRPAGRLAPIAPLIGVRAQSKALLRVRLPLQPFRKQSACLNINVALKTIN